jgi:predicted nucleic acid-binding protein
MEKIKIYLETTVFNYYFDEDREGHNDVVALFTEENLAKYDFYTSVYVLEEIAEAHNPKRKKCLNLWIYIR